MYKWHLLLGSYSQCPAGTCDGCTFHFLWESSGACPTCTERDYHQIEGACKGGHQVCGRIPSVLGQICFGSWLKPIGSEMNCWLSALILVFLWVDCVEIIASKRKKGCDSHIHSVNMDANNLKAHSPRLSSLCLSLCKTQNNLKHSTVLHTAPYVWGICKYNFPCACCLFNAVYVYVDPQDLLYVWTEPKLCIGGVTLPEKKTLPCEGMEFWVRLGAGLGAFTAVLLISLTCYFWKKNKRCLLFPLPTPLPPPCTVS